MNDEEIREKINDALNTQLDGMLYCDRTWSAWSYGTMSEDDFSNIVEDEDFMEETIDAVMAVIAESHPTIRTDNSKVIAELEAENKRLREELHEKESSCCELTAELNDSRNWGYDKCLLCGEPLKNE